MIRLAIFFHEKGFCIMWNIYMIVQYYTGRVTRFDHFVDWPQCEKIKAKRIYFKDFAFFASEQIF